MAGFFFDSSALVKLYHPESGTTTVDQIVGTRGNLIRVSRLTVAELTSAFAIKVRTQSISREDADVFLRQFRGDVTSGKLEVFSIGESEFAMAECWSSVTPLSPASVLWTLFNLRSRRNYGIRNWSNIL